MTDLESDMAAALRNDGKNVATAPAALPSGDAVAAALENVSARNTASDLVVDRLVQQVGIALTDVNASVIRRLDDLQAKIDRIRSKLKIENDAARGRIEKFVQLATDAAVASKSIDDALNKLDGALEGPSQ